MSTLRQRRSRRRLFNQAGPADTTAPFKSVIADEPVHRSWASPKGRGP